MIALAMAILLVAAPLESDQSEFNRSGDALSACMIQNTMDLDDGLSDAATIATAVTAACKMDLEIWKWEVWRASKSSGPIRDFQAMMDREVVPGLVLKGVLDYRRLRAKYLQHNSKPH